MERLKADGGYKLYEGDFYRVPMTKGAKEVAPLKTNYIELLNMVNNSEFELTEAADVIGRDTALIIDLLKIVNRMSRNGEIKSIRHAAAMLGQRELHKWINTAVAARLYADKPSEVTRLSLIRAKFAENLAPVFELAGRSQEAFLMGLFSVLDVILEKPMEEALEIVQVSKDVRKALLENDGMFAELRNFMKAYENADWQEIDRLSVIKGIDHEPVYKAFADALVWYRELARV
jgi:EAL and modified HD-GYP domain-containing signal transduction protein